MATTRVYILAKELGVKSSAIIKKCQDENLDIKNHMSVISAGLAATIQEWFSEGENVTTIETSEKVDLEKVRIKRKKKSAPVKKTKTEEETPEVDQETETEEETPAEVSQEQTETVSEKTEEETVQAKEPEPQVSDEPKEEPEAEEEPEEAKPEPEQKPEPEPEPEVIVPAGPILEKPEPAKLSGPQVVRVEAPEPLKSRRPKPRSRAKYNDPVTEPLMYSQGKGESFTPSTDKKGSPKKRKDRTHGRRRDETDSNAQRKGKGAGGKWRERDIQERRARLDAAGGESLRMRPSRKIAAKSKQASSGTPSRPSKVSISAPISVKDLSSALGIKATEIITKLMQHNVMANANQVISNEVAELISLEFDVELDIAHKVTIEKQIEKEFEEREGKNIKKRSVIAAMLGHVDHGKTSLLDKIRSSKVASGEAGGITQHIGASEIVWDDKKVTFIDTPGHEAFTAMRARGANMTDVVVLVVAADDGVMPQTIEAIAHSKAAGVPIIVALNKIDLPGCDINRIYAQLSEHGLTPSEWGGDTEVVKTSATTGEGVNDLLESLDYIAELLELKADDTIPATGWILEAKMSPKQGPLATILIKEGKLTKGDVIFAGTAYGRIKMMKNTYGKSIKVATSSMALEITGLNEIPQAGDRFYCLDDLNRAKAAAEENQTISREHSLSERNQVTLDNLFSQIEAGKTQTLNLIIRADVQGSVDVLKKYLSDLSTDEIKLNILHASTGGITEGDVVLAEASNAIIIGFNVVSDEYAAKTAEEKGVEIRLYSIIYRITEDLQKSMVGMLEPEEQEKNLGRAVVRQTFKISRIGTIAGCYVTSGVVTKNAKIRLIRNNIIIKDDLVLETLKHFKNDAKEVKSGLECGIKVAGFDDIKIDDVFDCYEIIKVARTL